MIRFTYCLLFVIFVISGCNDQEEKGIEMDIVETGCMNGWDDYYNGSKNFREAVEVYLNSYDISVYSVHKHNYYTGPVCRACSCPTGNMIVIRIVESDLSKAEDLGFRLVSDGRLNIPEDETR